MLNCSFLVPPCTDHLPFYLAEKFGFEGAFQSPIKVRLLSIEGVGESMNLFIIKHPTKVEQAFRTNGYVKLLGLTLF